MTGAVKAKQMIWEWSQLQDWTVLGYPVVQSDDLISLIRPPDNDFRCL